MRTFGGLFVRIVDPANLKEAMRRAALGKRDRGPVQRFLANQEAELDALHHDLESGVYRPGSYTQFRILDPKPRTISCAPFRDRVVHHALCAVCAPLLERRFISDSFACRVGFGAHAAINRARQLSRRRRYALRLDIARYFDSIDHETVEGLVHRAFRESALRHLWSVLIRHPVPRLPIGKGLPIGNLTSQWLANLYLDAFDHWAGEDRKVEGYVRYMDDMVIWADEKEKLWSFAEQAGAWLWAQRHLTIKPSSVRVLPVAEGLPFLGMRIFPGMVRVSGAALRRTRRRLGSRIAQWRTGRLPEKELWRAVVSVHGRFRFWGFKHLVRLPEAL